MGRLAAGHYTVAVTSGTGIIPAKNSRQCHNFGLGKQKKRRQVTKKKAVNLLTTSLPPAHPLCILHPPILFVASFHLEAFLTSSVLFFPAWSCAEIPANTDSRVLSLERQGNWPVISG